MRMNWRGLAATALALTGLFLAACGTTDDATTGDGGTPDTPATPTTTAAPATATAPAAPETSGALPDGETFVLIRGIEDDRLIVDPAEFLGGEDAAEAARADGFLGEDEDLPNDFYLRNLDEARIEIGLAPGAQFTLIGFDASGGLVEAEVDAATFLGLLSGDDTAAYYGFVATELPMHLEVEDGLVTAGMQQYVP